MKKEMVVLNRMIFENDTHKDNTDCYAIFYIIDWKSVIKNSQTVNMLQIT